MKGGSDDDDMCFFWCVVAVGCGRAPGCQNSHEANLVDSIENGGEGLKLIFTRAQSARDAKKAHNSADGKIKRKKEIFLERLCSDWFQ